MTGSGKYPSLTKNKSGGPGNCHSLVGNISSRFLTETYSAYVLGGANPPRRGRAAALMPTAPEPVLSWQAISPTGISHGGFMILMSISTNEHFKIRSLPFAVVTGNWHLYHKNLNNRTVCYVVGLSSSSSVKKLFFSVGGGRGAVFLLCFLSPFQRGEFWTSWHTVRLSEFFLLLLSYAAGLWAVGVSFLSFFPVIIPF